MRLRRQFLTRAGTAAVPAVLALDGIDDVAFVGSVTSTKGRAR